MRTRITASTALGFVVATLVGAAASTPVAGTERVDAIVSTNAAEFAGAQPIDWFRAAAAEKTTSAKRASPEPPSKLAIIACRVEAKLRPPAGAEPRVTQPDWLLPLECMRVVETVTDAAAMTNLWLRQMRPNLAHSGTCAEVAMHYAPEWEASHRNWLIVKIGCPTKIVDADGRTIGWHMPACQGTLPGTSYPLRCRFDPSEI